MGGGSALDGVENRRDRGVGVEKQGHIPHHGGYLGGPTSGRGAGPIQGLRLHLEEHRRLRQLVLCCHFGCSSPIHPAGLPRTRTRAETARVKSRDALPSRSARERRDEFSRSAFTSKKSRPRAGVSHCSSRHGAVGGGRCAWAGAPGHRERPSCADASPQVHAPDLEDADA